jgi:glucokinase
VGIEGQPGSARPSGGIDLGGTRIKAGLVVDGQLEAERVVAVAARDPDAIVAQLASVIAELTSDPTIPVGLAAAGVIDARTSTVRESPNFPSWKDFSLGARLARASGHPVYLENDANAVILGEAIYGVARGASSVVGYTLGTGVGGGILLAGRLWRGERGMAGELGHVTVVPDGRPCNCGNRGCLERYAGQVGIAETLLALGPPLSRLTDPEPSDAARRLSELAGHGDPDAIAIFAEVGRFLGQAAAAVVLTLDVTTLVLAGGVAGAFDLIAPAMQAELERRTFRSMSDGVRILHGTLGAHAGIFGAAASTLAALPD